MKVWLDGKVVDGAEARVPVTDHGFLYGDGIFEGIRAYSGRVFRLADHMRRLASGARAVGLGLPGGLDGIRAVVLETLRAHAQPDAYVRLIVSRGVGALGVDPTTCTEPRLVCIADDVRLYSPETLARGLALVTSSWRRPGPDVLDPRVKSLNYMNNVMAKQEARRSGADEALLLNGRGLVAEASVANVFAVRDGRLETPPVSDGALAGITRATVLEAADELGISSGERSLTRFDLLDADEVFLTGSGARVVPVGSLDGSSIGSGPGAVTKRLSDAYESRVRSEGTPFLL